MEKNSKMYKGLPWIDTFKTPNKALRFRQLLQLAVTVVAIFSWHSAVAHTTTNDYTLSCNWNDSLSRKGAWESGPTGPVGCSSDLVSIAARYHDTLAANYYSCLAISQELYGSASGDINDLGWSLYALTQRREIEVVHACIGFSAFHLNVADRNISYCPPYHHAVVNGLNLSDFSCQQDPNMAPTISGPSDFTAYTNQTFSNVGFFGLDIDHHPYDTLTYVEYNFPLWLDMSSTSGMLTNNRVLTSADIGTYCATAWVTDLEAWASKNFCITVVDSNRKPVITDFTIDPSPTRTGFTTLFTANASDPDSDPISYSWNFTDGTGTGRVTDHVFSISGNAISVTLTVTDSKGASASLSKNIQVIQNVAPTSVGFSWAPARPDPYTDLAHFVGTAFDANNDSLSTIWDVSDGTITPLTLNAFSFDHVFLGSGPYDVTLSVFDGWGGSASRTEQIYVDTPTTLSSISSSISVPRTNQSVTFTVNGTDFDPGDTPLTYSWTIFNSTTGALVLGPASGSTANNGDIGSITTSFADAGSYLVKVNATTARGKLSNLAQTTVIVDTAPTAVLRVTPEQVIAGQEGVMVDASGSTDPDSGDQEALVYIYELTSAPAGVATGTISSVTPDQNKFNYVVSMAGSYDFKVYVSDGKADAVTATAHLVAEKPLVVANVQMCLAGESYVDPYDPYGNGSDPISHSNGNSFEVEADYRGSGSLPLVFSRYYNSLVPSEMATAVGPNWRHTYSRSILRSGNVARVLRQDGSIIPFTLASSVWSTASSVPMKLEKITGGWKFTNADNTVENYDDNGRLTTVTNLAGQTLTLSYNGSGQLQQIADSVGRTLKLAYFSTSGPLQTLTDPNNKVTTYAYNGQNNVNKVTYTDTTTRTYLYTNTSFPTALTGILDENNQQYLEIGYDTQGRASYSQHAGSADKTSFTYNVGTITVNSKTYEGTEITDALNQKRTFYWRSENGIYQTRQYNAGAAKCSTCAAGSFKTATFDTNGNPDTQVDFNGNTTDFDYDNRGLEVQRIEALGTAQQRTVKTEWHTTFRLPTCVIEPDRTVAFAYDASGLLSSRTEVDTTNVAKFSTADSKRCVNINLGDTTLNKRAWTYTYYTSGVMKGLVNTINGPRTDVTDVTTYEYYTDAEVYKGNVKKITNALSQVTEFTEYDPSGRPLTVKDPNGLLTRFEYDTRGRLRFRREGVGADLTAYETTEYRYDNAGNLDIVISPNGALLNYDYDNAHRVTDIRDQLNNHIHYTLDALGNRLKVEVYDPSNVLVRSHTNTYFSTNRQNESRDSANPSGSVAPGVTKYLKADNSEGYDADGNLTDILDAENRRTQFAYDALNRVRQTTDAKLGATVYTYDAYNRIKAVTDPNLIVTTYSYDGLGNLTKIDSKDAGITQFTKYDGAGNPTERFDARNKKTIYAYDALNRIDLVTYNDNSTADYVYDLGTNGIGRLTSITDTSGKTSYTYDLHGRVNTKTHLVGGKSFVMTYTYDAKGQLDTIKYPSNQTVKYNYTNSVTSSLNIQGGAILVQNMAYEPFGALSRWNFGNNAAVTHSYDSDGRMRSYTLGTGSRTLDYYPSGNVFHIKDPGNSANDQTFGYDELYRLTSYTGPGATYGYAYDANGNRTSAAINGTNYAYGNVPSTNRFNNVAGPVARTFSYDVAGSITGDTKHTFGYDDRGRLTSLDSGNGTYAINSLGQRVKKVFNVTGQRGDANADGQINSSDRATTINAILGTAAPGNADCNNDSTITVQDLVCLNSLIVTGTTASDTRHFAYDEAGHLRGEYDVNGNTLQEYVWFGDMPMAVLKGGAVYNIYTDHLNTPRAITNQSNTVLWSWQGEPFGASAANEDVDGDGTKFNFNQRFAGQYYDAESGLHYNVNREYDPSTGRYISSDPIGLAGGMNTYTYAKGNPLKFVDRFGLDTTEKSPNPQKPNVNILKSIGKGFMGVACAYNDFNYSRCEAALAKSEQDYKDEYDPLHAGCQADYLACGQAQTNESFDNCRATAEECFAKEGRVLNQKTLRDAEILQRYPFNQDLKTDCDLLDAIDPKNILIPGM